MMRICNTAALISILTCTRLLAQSINAGQNVNLSDELVSFTDHLSNLETLAQLTVRAIVKPTGPMQIVTREVQAAGQNSEEQLIAFEVTIVSGAGVAKGETYRCITRIPQTGALASKEASFLLLGWRPINGRLSLEPTKRAELDSGQRPDSIRSESLDLYAYSFVPTTQLGVIQRSENTSSVLATVTAALADSHPNTLRMITTEMSMMPDLDRSQTIEGVDLGKWKRSVLSDLLEKIPMKTAIMRFRIKGLLSTWRRQENALSFIQDLPTLVQALSEGYLEFSRRTSLSRRWFSAKEDDQIFLGKLDLVTGLDPDELFQIIWKNPGLRWLALDSRINKPSLEHQKRMLSFLDSPKTYERLGALNRFAGWYGEWDKKTTEKRLPNGGGTYIPREDELKSYWIKKLGSGSPPPTNSLREYLIESLH